jgi:carboxypeptidase PM20D1
MRRIAPIALSAVLIGVFAVCGVAVVRTMQFATPAPASDAPTPDLDAITIDRDAALARLGQAIQLNTVSLADAENDDRSGFDAWQTWLAETYPAFHAAARLERVADLSLLYTWQGADAAQSPILLLAHQDTVPVPPDTVEQWKAPAFGGELRDGHVWGRGTLDDKSSLIALMEAAENFAVAGRQPQRTIIFAFGHDEELGGDGAREMAALLESRGVRAWFARDEGMAAIREHPLTGGPAALIGVSEKGSGTLLIRAVGEPGHSSMPPRETAISSLALAVTRIHDMPITRSVAGGPAEGMMRALAQDMPLTTRAALANEWLLAPVLRAQLADDRAAQALLGTTIAPTVISGGDRNNVLPGEASARINLRIHPRDAPEDLLARARSAIEGLEGVSVDWENPPRAASPVSHSDSSSFALIASLSRALLPEAPVAPGLVIAATDSRHYARVAENVYRYQPILLGPEDWESVHGLNERISVENFERLIRFYTGLIEAGAM